MENGITLSLHHLVEILPNLYLGSWASDLYPLILHGNGINVIISIMGQKIAPALVSGDNSSAPPGTRVPTSLWQSYLEYGIKRKNFYDPCISSDGEDVLFIIPTVVRMIEDSLRDGKKVVIHSGEGMEKAISVLAAYLMKAQGGDTIDAETLIRTRRGLVPEGGPVEDLDESYYDQLAAWDLCNRALYKKVNGVIAAKGPYAEWRESKAHLPSTWKLQTIPATDIPIGRPPLGEWST